MLELINKDKLSKLFIFFAIICVIASAIDLTFLIFAILSILFYVLIKG